MRVAVLGAGAIGGSLGALLGMHGHDVTLVGRPSQVAAIRESGLHVDGCLGPFTPKVRCAEALEARPDLALLAVKTQDVEGAVAQNERFLRGAPLVTLQNGVRSDALVAQILPREMLLSAVVQVTATYLEPGRITLVDRGRLVLGRPDAPRDGLVAEVAAILDPAVPTAVTDNVRGAHWLKLIMNLNNALPALTNRPVREAFADPFLRRLAVRLMREGVRVADRAGVELESLGGVSVGTVRMITRLPVPWAARMFGSRARGLEGDWPILGSTLQSLRRGRPTEIDYLNGEIVREGQRLGILPPVNGKTVELVHQVERTGHFFAPEDLRAEFRRAAAR